MPNEIIICVACKRAYWGSPDAMGVCKTCSRYNSLKGVRVARGGAVSRMYHARIMARRRKLTGQGKEA